MGPKMKQLKNWLKTTGVEIHLRRKLFKDHQRKGYEGRSWNSKEYNEYFDNFENLYKLRREYRHKHIAYSELRGKVRSQIENPREDNLPNEEWIDKIKIEYTDQSCVAERLGSGF